MTEALVQWSGAAMPEDAMREQYGTVFVDYVRRDLAFFPMPYARGR
tara:strand:- start:583 stop:720 length:138 start_codon:yes stop_codon:yes gene_type:complete